MGEDENRGDEKLVMYCLNLRNCCGDNRGYYVAGEEVVGRIKRRIDETSKDGSHVFVSPKFKTRILYNPKWGDSLEFISVSKESAILCAQEMGFQGLFLKS